MDANANVETDEKKRRLSLVPTTSVTRLSLGPGVMAHRIVAAVIDTECVLVEVKSGKGYGIADELAFYALVETLCGGAAPAIVVGLTLVPSATLHPLPVDADLLARAANRVVETVQLCREVDESIAARRWPRTFPGPHCGFCDLAERCPDIPDEQLFEAHQRAAHDMDDEGDAVEEEPW